MPMLLSTPSFAKKNLRQQSNPDVTYFISFANFLK